MKEQFVTYEIALKLKELGFNEECFGRWFIGDEKYSPSIFFNKDYKNRVISNNYCSINYSILAPLWQQAIDWFRKNLNLHIVIKTEYDGTFIITIYNMNSQQKANRCFYQYDSQYDSYEDARQVAILKAIEIAKK